ncbi:MAG: hypothetical protein HRT87_09795 [Legionellales bacterium]|nr:hypothetical protein [Legionellales bacterium]
MNRFEEDFIRGYSQKNIEFFKRWCVKAYNVLGDVSQAGFVQVDNQGRSIIGANRPDIGYNCLDHEIWKKHNIFSFIKNFRGHKFIVDSNNYYYDKKSNKYMLQAFAFMCRLYINENVQRTVWFASDNPGIHTALVNNIGYVEKIVQEFNKDINTIINRCKEDEMKMIQYKSNYFLEKDVFDITSLSKVNDILQDNYILSADKQITEREWECLTLYLQGKSARETGSILNISRRTVEKYFDILKKKLNVTSKEEILDKIT